MAIHSFEIKAIIIIVTDLKGGGDELKDLGFADEFLNMMGDVSINRNI